MVGAFLWPTEKRDSYNHALLELVGTTYEIYLALWRRAENLRLEAVAEEFNQRRQEFASRDEDKENDSDLSPAEKARVLRNALKTRNQVGWITFEQKHETHLIKITKLGLQRIQKLFELNPELTPAKLLPVMDDCINEFIGRPAPPKEMRAWCPLACPHGPQIRHFRQLPENHRHTTRSRFTGKNLLGRRQTR